MERGDPSHDALMANVARAFAEGDLRPLLAAIDDEVVWTSAAPVDFFRFGGVHRGRAGVVEAEAQIFAAYRISRFEPVKIVTAADVVWGLFRVEAVHMRSNKPVETDYAVFWRMRNGKVVEHRDFFDTAAVLMQQGELSRPAR